MRNNPELWEKIIQKVKASDKGGKPGQWSARKAQLAVALYKKAGGTYSGSKKGNALVKWTEENWRTKSGNPSVMGSRATGERYLPSKVIKKLTSKEYNYTTKLKREALKKGKQYSGNPKKIKKKVSSYLHRYSKRS